MQISLVRPSLLTLELGKVTPSPELAERYAIIRQLFARRSWSGDPKELLDANGKLNLQASLPDVWEKLTRLEKISALFQSRGFKTVCTQLPSLQQGPMEELARRLNAYQAEVEALTGGVMTAPAIPHYLALRNFLLADATAFMELFQKVSHRLTMGKIDEKGSKCVTIKDLQEVIPVQLRTLFTIIDSACFSNALEDVTKAKDLLTICSEIIESCRQAFEKVRGEVELKSLFDRIDRAWNSFQALQKALDDPLHLLPVLLQPVQAQRVSSIDCKVDHQDQVNLDDAALGWLNDCQIGFQNCIEAGLQSIKKQKGQTNQIKTACAQILKNLQEWSHAIAQEVNFLRELQPHEKVAQLLDRVQKCSNRLKEIESSYSEVLQSQVFKNVEQNSFVGRQLFDRPIRLYSLIANGIVSSLQIRADHMLKVNQLMTGFCSPELQQRSSFYTPMDLLDLQVREALEQFRLEAVQGKDVDKKPKVEACLSQITATVSQFIEWMRWEYRKNGIDAAARSRAFDRVRLFRPLMKRFIAATEVAADKPGMQRLTNAVELLSELVVLDCWPLLLNKGTQAKPQMERQTMFRLFVCSLREFVRNDLKGVYWQLDSNPLLKKKSEAIKDLLKQLQLDLSKEPEPTLDNFEDYASHCFAKLLKTSARIQQREEAMLQAIEGHSEYDAMCDTIRSGRQVLERSFFILNRGLISDLLSRELIVEEKESEPVISTEIQVEESEEEALDPEEIVAIPAPAAAPSAPKLRETSPELFKKLYERCQFLHEQNRGFILHSKEPKLQFLHQFQGEAINNLIHSMHYLRELIRKSNRPVCVSEIYLRLAVLLEQASKLALSFKGVAATDDSLAKIGREGWRWQEHNPLHYCRILEKAGAVSWTSQQIEVIKRLERVIEVSSRYPNSGRDSHLTDLKAALAQKLDPQKLEKLLQISLESCLSILDSICASPEQKKSESPYDLQKLAQHLQEVSPGENNFQKEAERLLHGLQQRVKRLNIYRLVPQCREVVPLGDADCSTKRREGTIDAALNNMVSILELSADILLGPEDQDLCLTLASAGLRQQAVLLELGSLIELAQGAYPSVRDPKQHYLFTEADAPIKRYSHDLGQFSEMLRFSQKWHRVCKSLTPYLRSGYRYEGFEGLEGFRVLSQLRDRMITGQLTVSEFLLLKGESLQDKLDLLNRIIVSKFREEVKAPLVETLQLMDILLKNFEERIRLNV